MTRRWRRCSLPSSESVVRGTRPSRIRRYWRLVTKEWGELFASRATMWCALAIGPLVGHAFITAVETYAEVSGSAGGAAALSQGISPLDGLLVPTFGAYALVATLLLPFVAIRAVSAERESGAMALQLQGPTSLGAQLTIKALVLMMAWVLAWTPGLIAVWLWSQYGGHVHAGELLTVLSGHLLRGTLVVAMALAAGALTESAASAAVVTLAATLGLWALDFIAQVRGGVAMQLARYTPESALRTFEQGEWSWSVVLVTLIVGMTLLAAGGVWLQTGWRTARRLRWSASAMAIGALLAFGSARVRQSVDVSEDRRNSFAIEDEQALSALQRVPGGILTVRVNLAPEDPRLTDLQRSVLHKLERLIPVHVVNTSRTSTGLFEPASSGYGEVWYEWNGQRRMTRSTTVPIVLETLYDLTGIAPPAVRAADPYSGYPLRATPRYAATLFYGVCPLLVLIVAAWSRRRVARV